MAKKEEKKKESKAKKTIVKKDSKVKDVKKAKRIKKAKPKKIIQRDYYLFDCSKEPLGRMATKVATTLIGKNKVIFTPHLDQGDYAVVINAEKIILTGKKADQKVYYHHTGYPGAIKMQTFRERLQKNPERIVYAAVSGMLPKNSLGERMIKRLKIFRGSEHPFGDKIKNI